MRLNTMSDSQRKSPCMVFEKNSQVASEKWNKDHRRTVDENKYILQDVVDERVTSLATKKKQYGQ